MYIICQVALLHLQSVSTELCSWHAEVEQESSNLRWGLPTRMIRNERMVLPSFGCGWIWWNFGEINAISIINQPFSRSPNDGNPHMDTLGSKQTVDCTHWQKTLGEDRLRQAADCCAASNKGSLPARLWNSKFRIPKTMPTFFRSPCQAGCSKCYWSHVPILRTE